MSDSLPHFDMILFGATGDLAMRKLLPSLYQAHVAGLLHPQGRILGVSRSQFSTAQYLAKVQTDAKIHIKSHFSEQQWQSFCQRIEYLSLNVNQPDDFKALAEKVHARSASDSIVIYLSVAPQFFTLACQGLASVGLNNDKVRIVLEKPLGTDWQSSREINTAVGAFFQENQIYRIDHYLGKESLQNILPLRFGNVFFEPIWNQQFIQSVQITIAEQLGVEERGEFYDTTGALRDMLQNHLMQMLCFVAMERPVSLDANAIRDEKLKVLQALRPLSLQDVDRFVVRGQYTQANGFNAYQQEHRVPVDSQTETYVAVRAQIDNPRWQGVPFYLRTGKRMASRTAEIVINFKKLPNQLFGAANRLIIRLQPDETVALRLNSKLPGNGLQTVPTEMVLNLGQAVNGRRADAYELLLREVIDGRLALFNRRDELEASWAWVMPILDNWRESPIAPFPYEAGGWGPVQADELLARDGNAWLENQD